MSINETTTLFRPVGQKELELIEAAGWRRFPPRLFWQPIFYPVLTEEYAIGTLKTRTQALSDMCCGSRFELGFWTST
jgi:hypothetical protein